MTFNEKLLDGIEENDLGLAKIILFCLKEDLNIYHFFQAENAVIDANGMKVIIRDELYTEAARIVNKLIETGAIMVSYPVGKASRMTITEQLYVLEPVSDFDPDELRNIYPLGQRSDKQTIRAALARWFGRNPGYTMADITKATYRYLNWCKSTQRPIRDLLNFIEDADGQSFLTQWLEERKVSSAPSRNDAI